MTGMKSILVVLALCSTASAATVSITDYGAICDGITDDRSAIQSAIAAAGSGGTVTFPPVVSCMVARGSNFWGLRVTAPVTLYGPGSTLVMDRASSLGDTKLIEIESGDVIVDGLTLVGQRALGDVGEHRHGVNAVGAPRLTIRNVTARGFVGDGIYLYNGCDDATVTNVVATDNGRNGLTLGGLIYRVDVTHSQFFGNVAQQFDSEAPIGHQDDVTITDSYFDTGAVTQQYVLTISGSSPTQRSKNWIVERNIINGGVLIVWGDGTRIRYNSGVNPTKFGWRVYRETIDTEISHNTLVATQSSTAGAGVMSVAGTAAGPPRDTLIEHNTIVAAGGIATNGIRGEGAASLRVRYNTMTGPSVWSFAGNSAAVYMRTTSVAYPWDGNSEVIGNTFDAWGDAAIVIQGNGAAIMGRLAVMSNTFTPSATLHYGMSLDDGTGCASDVIVAGNEATGLTGGLIRNPPTGAMAPWGSRWIKP